MSNTNIKVESKNSQKVILGHGPSGRAIPYDPDIQIGGSYRHNIVLSNDGQVGSSIEDRSGMALYRRNDKGSGGFLADRFGR